MRKKVLLCLTIAGLCAGMLIGCGKDGTEEHGANSNEVQSEGQQAGENAGSGAGQEDSGAADGDGQEATGTGDEPAQETKKPAKEWSTPEDYRVVADYVVPESIADSEYDMEVAISK